MHTEWLNNEYQQWIKALQESTVDNFKEHPMVRRMLSLNMETNAYDKSMTKDFSDILNTIEQIGNQSDIYPRDHCRRMIHYAQIILRSNPSHICEIGGGVGQFYAILRALGYKGKYWIFDLPEVQKFQGRYLARVNEVTGLDTTLSFGEFDYCVSFYAYGEFDDATKAHYLPIIQKCPHGFMIYNPHSGASSEIPFGCTVTDEYPLTSPGNKQLVW